MSSSVLQLFLSLSWLSKQKERLVKVTYSGGVPRRWNFLNCIWTRSPFLAINVNIHWRLCLSGFNISGARKIPSRGPCSPLMISWSHSAFVRRKIKEKRNTNYNQKITERFKINLFKFKKHLFTILILFLIIWLV